jgi:hypothetical protein
MSLTKIIVAATKCQIPKKRIGSYEQTMAIVFADSWPGDIFKNGLDPCPKGKACSLLSRDLLKFSKIQLPEFPELALKLHCCIELLRTR